MFLHTETLFIIELCYFPGVCCCLGFPGNLSNDYYCFLKIATNQDAYLLAALPYKAFLHVMELIEK